MSGVERKPQNPLNVTPTESFHDTTLESQTIEYREALELKDYLAQVVRHAGEDILKFQGEIVDKGVIGSHETSSIDYHSKSCMEHYLGLFLPNIEGVRRFELMPYEMTLIPEGDEGSKAKKYYLIIDELDGTTNTKRALASSLLFRPQASVSIGLSLTEKLGDLQVAAVYDIARQETFTAMKIGKNFLSFLGDSK
jgi:hypothetical protein